jgi:CSLREA domain-containing protein
MNRLALALLFLTALGTAIVLLAGLGAEASPATYTVNSTADPGDGTCDGTECTLREAIAAANANVGTDTIEFDIAGTGPHTISPASGLPTITDSVIIDGTSEPDFVGAPIIELDGSGAGADANGLRITAANSTVKGLVISSFDGDGVELSGIGATGNMVQGNYIGTDVTGSADLGNSSNGVHVRSGAASNTIGGTAVGEGNVISGNGESDQEAGIYIGDGGTDNNVVKGNYIGTDASGTTAVPNLYGIYIRGGPKNNIIGGPNTGDRNVISGNTSNGVQIYAGGSNGNKVQGNYVGIDYTGAVSLANGGDGVRIETAGSPGPQNNTVGGPNAGEGNVISGNAACGVTIANEGSSSNTVEGNYIGINPAGTASISNSCGVLIVNASGNTVGGDSAAERNVISGNTNYGVHIYGAAHPTNDNSVMGNYIGTNHDGTAAVPNGTGVRVEGDADNNTIGGTSSGEGNVIAYNSADGVRVDGASSTGNTIGGNSIYSNGGKGIENINGGNGELAPPVIDSAGSASGHSDPKCYPCTVEVFSDDQDEGHTYHGSAITNDDATGTWTYPGSVIGPNITATITDASGNTSEFSAPVAYRLPFVGGIAELADASGSSGRNHMTLAALAAAALVALTAGAWYARRRRLR